MSAIKLLPGNKNSGLEFIIRQLQVVIIFAFFYWMAVHFHKRYPAYDPLLKPKIGEIESEKEKKEVAKRSFQNLMITCLEYFRLHKSRDNIEEIVVCDDPSPLLDAYKKGKGVVFVSGHQSNWEVCFLDISKRVPAIAIGKPQKSLPLIYEWVISIREMMGGKIIKPKKDIGFTRV